MLPYLEITEARYPHEAASTFTVETYGAGMDLLRGPCPRCLTVIEIPVFREIVKGGSGESGPLDEPAGEPVICTCDEEHEARPANRKGCGAYWNLIL